jgi:KUP system potassium uptake protein
MTFRSREGDPTVAGPETPVLTRQRTRKQRSLPAMMVGALGIVFGDIGTSPLYTLQVGLAPEPGTHPARGDVLGVLSLILWALTLVVSVKYVTFVMRADNHGEGGIFALLGLLPKPRRPEGPPSDAVTQQVARLPLIVGMIIAGAALLYGDGIITPAISVLSAMEGITLAAPRFVPWIIPLTCIVLLGLFLVQRKGTGKLGLVFGPVMLLWFIAIGAMGARQILRHPEALWAISPTYGAAYFGTHGLRGIAILGVVVLAVTGGEALYADMGHFGPTPIRRAWFFVVFPALVLCYLGQGALVLADPNDDQVLSNPFFGMAPGTGAALGLVGLATLATVIASQALISGVFSLTQQGISLGLFPRMTIAHTAAEAEGQIYVPEINVLVAIACIALVLVFKKSANLANAFGLAVSGTMLVTSFAYYAVLRRTWSWPRLRAVPVLLLFLGFDIPFVVANSLKFLEGGFVPVAVGTVFFIIMVIWRRGRALLGEQLRARTMPLAELRALLREQRVSRPPGGSIFLTSHDHDIPPIMALNVNRLRALQEQAMLLSVRFEHVPFVAPSACGTATIEGDGLYRVVLRYGYMDKPNVPEGLARVIQNHGLPFDLDSVVYVLGRETIVGGAGGFMSSPVERMFGFLQRNAKTVTEYFQLPCDQALEIGIQVDL